MSEFAPRVYVASLTDYNAGILHGEWIDATLDTEDMQEAVQAMLAKSPEAATEFSRKHGLIAEEWAIHDYDDFGPIKLGEWESFEKVSAIANLLTEYGEAFAVWYAAETREGDQRDLEMSFQDASVREIESERDFAMELAEETVENWNDRSADWPFNCIDWDYAAKEIMQNMTTARYDGTLYVWEDN